MSAVLCQLYVVHILICSLVEQLFSYYFALTVLLYAVHQYTVRGCVSCIVCITALCDHTC